MQPLSETQTQKVWSRVMNAKAVPAMAGAEDSTLSGLTAETLQELVMQERTDSATYALLASRLRGRARAMLQELAGQEQCHAKKFAALYFLQTGKKLCPPPGRPECVTCINETLRQRYAAELADYARYLELAKAAGAQRCMLEGIAAEECRHAQMIVCILQNCL